MFNLRNDALKWFQEKETEKLKKACEESDQLKKFAVQQQMKVEVVYDKVDNRLKRRNLCIHSYSIYIYY